MINDLKLNQKREWICAYTKKPNGYVFKVNYIGKEYVVVTNLDGSEDADRIETILEETVPVNKLKKDKQ